MCINASVIFARPGTPRKLNGPARDSSKKATPTIVNTFTGLLTVLNNTKRNTLATTAIIKELNITGRGPNGFPGGNKTRSFSVPVDLAIK